MFLVVMVFYESKNPILLKSWMVSDAYPFTIKEVKIIPARDDSSLTLP